MMNKVYPLQGVRVLNLGGVWAGRVASMLLADQGAEVIEINHPDREDKLEDAALGRGKTAVILDLKVPYDRHAALRLANEADIVIDNLGPGRAARFGLDYESIRDRNESVVYVSIPGFAEGSEWDGVAAFEGTVAASVGAYTDIHALGPVLGGRPIFSSLPMASAYGGVHAAIAATMAYLRRLQTHDGCRVEVPLADALMSAMAVLVMKVDGQPQRFDLPPIDKAMSEVAFPIFRDMSDDISEAGRAAINAYLAKFGRPQFGNYLCGDGKMVFINAVDHVHHAQACLDVLGILNDLIAEGMIVGSPYEEDGSGNNISYSAGLSPRWTQRLRTLMSQRFLTKPAHVWEQLLREAAVPVTVVRTTQEWLDLPAAHAGGNVSEVEDPIFGAVRQPGRYISIEGPDVQSHDLRSRDINQVEIGWKSNRATAEASVPHEPSPKILSGLRVLDLSNVIAGPAACRILAEFGADVTRIDPPAPQAGPRMTMWFGIDVNQGKRSIILDLKTAEGRAVFETMVKNADVVLHNFLDVTAARLGLSDEALRRINPDIISCQVSAWGGPLGGPLKGYPSFDPVLQAATGVTARYGTPEAPVLHGMASCVDYITGFTAALGVAQALVARKLGRGGSYVRTSLSMGAQLVQFPFAVSAKGEPTGSEPSTQSVPGYGPHYRMYKAKDRWAFLACRPKDFAAIAELLGASEPTDSSVAAAIAGRTCMEVSQLLEDCRSASFVPIIRLDQVREACTVSDVPNLELNGRVLAMREADHPSGHRVNLPLPTWYRFGNQNVGPLAPAPEPGFHTHQVLHELGKSEAEIRELFAKNVARRDWAVLKHYLPL
ncbi:CoA transferase [Paraburkholderia sp. UYCP14C]|uniref:CaiB/BaiF CoA-transferase family protein n=1 Tax=Paraburkholderia sp. UYCP14C TaxID=2511130 RepID=UPI001459FEA7|nr:CoA transferase [Paraburkholderia sp. UYCP14C]